MDAHPVVIITGASQGIGAGLVAGYRRLGYAVVANSRNVSPSDDPMVLAVPGDIAQPGVGHRIVDAARERLCHIRTLVNNAGIFISKPFTEYTDAEYDAITGVNLRGFFEVSRAAVSAMLSGAEGGHLVNISTSLVDHADSALPSALASLTKGTGDRVRGARNPLQCCRSRRDLPSHARPGNLQHVGQETSARAGWRYRRCRRSRVVSMELVVCHRRDPARGWRSKCRTLRR